MRVLLVAFCLLLNMDRVHALSVLWWNTGGGDSFEKADLFTSYELNESLARIVKEHSPDMLVLGEYHDRLLSSETYQKLVSLFPYVQKFDYNFKRPLKIAVFSNLRFKYDYIPEVLTWKSVIKSGDFEKDRYNRRSFQRLVVKKDGHEINLVPFHALMPWTDIETNSKGLSRISKKLGILEVGYEILFSTDNILGYQSKMFRKQLDYYKSKSSPHSSWVIFGDFNVPAHYGHIETEIFKLIRGDFEEGEREGDIDYSFPYPNTRSGMKFQIDHVLSNMTDVNYRFLKYPGSDHFPMLFNL